MLFIYVYFQLNRYYFKNFVQFILVIRNYSNYSIILKIKLFNLSRFAENFLTNRKTKRFELIKIIRIIKNDLNTYSMWIDQSFEYSHSNELRRKRGERSWVQYCFECFFFIFLFLIIFYRLYSKLWFQVHHRRPRKPSIIKFHSNRHFVISNFSILSSLSDLSYASNNSLSHQIFEKI